jgi:riboflavin kinase/FMN adenylyltransferase
VVRGDRHGREIGFPTANVRTANELLPPNGVYATAVRIGGDDRVHASVTNVGVRPTFGQSAQTTVETHVFDLDRDVYGAGLRLYFVQRLRDERAFADVDALREQIEADCRYARRLFSRISL